MRSAIRPEEIAQFHQKGYVRLGQVLNDDELIRLQHRIDDIMLGKIRYENMLMQLDSDSGNYEDLSAQTSSFKGPTLKYRKIEQLEKDEEFLRYMSGELVHSIANEFIGEEVSIYRSMFMNKPANFGTLLPWHQDGGTGWGLSIDPQVTIWLALDPATKENGCVQVIPGSHKLGLLSKRGHTISDEHAQEYCPEEQVDYLELKAGEAVLLHNFTLHRSNKNNSSQSRRAFSLCLMDASTEHIPSGQPSGRVFPKLFGQNSLSEKVLSH